MSQPTNLAWTRASLIVDDQLNIWAGSASECCCDIKVENGGRKATTEIKNAQAKNLIKFVRTFGMVGPDCIFTYKLSVWITNLVAEVIQFLLEQTPTALQCGGNKGNLPIHSLCTSNPRWIRYIICMAFVKLPSQPWIAKVVRLLWWLPWRRHRWMFYFIWKPTLVSQLRGSAANFGVGRLTPPCVQTKKFACNTKNGNSNQRLRTLSQEVKVLKIRNIKFCMLGGLAHETSRQLYSV